MKGTAISADWVGYIQQAYDRLEEDMETEYKKFGIAFNQGLILMLILPIHNINLRSLDVTDVSITCVGMFLFHEILCFMIQSFCVVQVIKTFGICDLFHEAISECLDIIPSTFPLLLKNKSSGGGNVWKLTTTRHCH